MTYNTAASRIEQITIPAGTSFYEASGTACFGQELTVTEEKKVGDTVRLFRYDWKISSITLTKNGKLRVKINTWSENGNNFRKEELLKRTYLQK